MQRYQGRQTVKSISKVNQTNREVSVGAEEGKQRRSSIAPSLHLHSEEILQGNASNAGQIGL